MLQRVMIAGALSCEPGLIIADEATTALDVTVQSDILAILRHLQESRSLSMLFITHDLALASVICDRVVVMYAGRPMAVQAAADLFDAPAHPYAAALVGRPPPYGPQGRAAAGGAGTSRLRAGGDAGLPVPAPVRLRDL